MESPRLINLFSFFQGFRVFAACLLAESRGVGAESLRKIKSNRLHVLQLDVTSQAQMDKTVKEVKKLLPDGGKESWSEETGFRNGRGKGEIK